MTENVTEKWSLLAELLDTFADAGAMFSLVGDAREARLEFNQALLVAQTFRLAKR